MRKFGMLQGLERLGAITRNMKNFAFIITLITLLMAPVYGAMQQNLGLERLETTPLPEKCLVAGKLSQNHLTSNTLIPNVLTPNMLISNTLTSNAPISDVLTSNTLSPNAPTPDVLIPNVPTPNVLTSKLLSQTSLSNLIPSLSPATLAQIIHSGRLVAEAQTTPKKNIQESTRQSGEAGTEFPIVVSISPELDRKISAIIDKGISEVYAGHYKKGLETFNTIRNIAGDHPVSYIYPGVVYYLIIVDLKNGDYIPALEEELKKTIKVGKRWLKRNDSEDAWARFYIAVAYGVRGLFNAVYGNYLKAFSDAFKGLKHMKAITARDSDFYDALYAIGLYDYWYATYLGVFMNSYEKRRRQDSGIASLKAAFRKGTLTRTFAGSALVEIYMTEKRFEEGYEIADYFQENYPNFLSVYENIGRLYTRSKSPDEIIAFYQKVRQYVAQNSYNISLSYVIIDHNVANAYHKKGDTQKSKEILTTLMALKDIDAQATSDDVPDYLKNYYTRSQELLKKLN